MTNKKKRPVDVPGKQERIQATKEGSVFAPPALQIPRLLQSAAAILVPSVSYDIEDWAKTQCFLANSGVFASFDYIPWALDPCKAVVSGEYKEINISSPIGTGKTTLEEILIVWMVSQDPNNLMFVAQSGDTVNHWFETRMLPILEQSPATKDIMKLLGKTDVKKGLVKFPSQTYLAIGSQTPNFLNAKSIRTVLNDEVWLWKKGHLNLARKRLQNNPLGMVINVSQGGVKSDDFSKACEDGEIHDYSWRCPKCSEYHPYAMEFIQWDQGIRFDVDNKIDYKALQNSVHMLCPSCSHVIEDEPATRHKLISTSKYIARPNQKPIPGHITYKYTILANYRVPWGEMVREFVLANHYKNKGDVAKLREFIQQRLGDTWEDQLTQDDSGIETQNFLKKACANPLDDEETRIMSVDTQGSHKFAPYFWVVILSFKKDSIHLCYEGKVADEAALIKLESQYNIPKHRTIVDSGYRTEEVFEMCARHEWLAADGVKTGHSMYKHKVGKTIAERPYSTAKQQYTRVGKCISYTYHSSRAKDMAYRVKSGQSSFALNLPLDISKQFKKHWFSEAKQIDPTDGVIKWVTLSNDNHLWDCFCQGLIAGMIFKVF